MCREVTSKVATTTTTITNTPYFVTTETIILQSCSIDNGTIAGNQESAKERNVPTSA